MSFLTVLLSPITLLFGLVLAGLAIGKIRIGHFSLGIAGVLFISILAGALMKYMISETHVELILNVQSTMKSFSTLGSSLFVSVIGLQTGFSIKNNSGRSLLCFVIGILMSLSGVLTMLVISAIDQTIRYPILLGVLCGALTSTPGLSGVCELLGDGSNEAVWGYGCSYLLGVVFVVLFAQMFARKTTDQGEAIPNMAIPTSRIYPEMILISTVAMLGYVLGSFDIPVLHISMGSTACMLIIGLLAGFLVQKKLGTAQTASPVFNSFRTLGLSLFFVGNGLTTGMQALNFDFRIVLYGAIITLAAIFCGLLLCNLLFSQQKLHTEFVVAGGMTSSPAYGAISSSANEMSVNCFSFAYFGALLSLVITIQIIGR